MKFIVVLLMSCSAFGQMQHDRIKATDVTATTEHPASLIAGDPYLDARYSGFVCATSYTTAATDNSAAWNALFNSLDSATGKTVKLPPCPIRVDEATVFGQDSLTIAGWGEGVNTAGAVAFGGHQSTVIFSCSSNTGGVITVNRSSRIVIKNIEFEISGAKAAGGGCTSNKTKDIVGQNSGGTGYTPTIWIFDHISSLSGVTNYVGVDLSFTPNGEQMTFISPYFNCQNSTNSEAINFGGGNEDLAKITGEPRLVGCFRTVRSQAPNLEISGGFVSGGEKSIYGVTTGAGIYIDSCQRVHVHDVEESDSGQFLRIGAEDGEGGSCEHITIDHNTIAPLDIGAGVNLITITGAGGTGFADVHDNVFNVADAAYNKAIIGEQLFSAQGPQGQLVEYNNQITGTSQPITDPAHPFQGGEFHLATPPTTFAKLPSCTASGVEGRRQAITDSTTAVWGATITGGGTNHVLAYCDGTAWTVEAK